MYNNAYCRLTKKAAISSKTKSYPKSAAESVDFFSNEFADVKSSDFRPKGQCMIGAYNSRVPVVFHGFKPHEIRIPFFGVELEVEFRDWAAPMRESIAHSVIECFGKKVQNTAFVLVKHDGSLAMGGKGGFEICTNPATLSYHKEAWRKFFENKDRLPLVVSERTGLHIHLSRCAITPLISGKILAFIHNPANSAFVRTVAGRGSCHFADYSRPVKPSYVLRSGNFSHYSAFNAGLQSTVEFRIFAATLNYARFMSCLEFVSALIEFCSQAGFKVVNKVAVPPDANDFIRFMSQPANRASYPNLFAFLKKHFSI